MNNEQQEILDEVYENYLSKAKNYTTEDLFYNKLSGAGDIIEGMLSAHTRDFIPYSQEEFINKCKTDTEFSKKWGLMIEERELSEEERRKLANYDSVFVSPMTVESWDRNNIPTKVITIIYNDKTIESYK